MGRQYRPQPSRIDLLPDDLREELEAKLADRRQTQQQILAWLNEPVAALGEPPISPSGLSRFAKRAAVAGRKVREADAAAAAVVRASGGHVGAGARAMLQAAIFEQAENPQDPDAILKLGRASLSIEGAAKKEAKRRTIEDDRAVLKKGADAAEAVARRADVSPAGIAALRAAVEGAAEDAAEGAAEGAAA